MSTQTRALNAYRSALRATKIAFDNDVTRLSAARFQIKNEMKLPKSTTNPKFTEIQRIELLENVSSFLKHNIVQGVKKSTEEKSKSRYALNIHKDTELGDNEEIKKNKSRFGSGSNNTVTGGGCCGGGQIELEQKKS